MTDIKAIKNLKDILNECTESEEAVCYITDVDVPTLVKAINALDKQIPKKPHKNFEKFSGVWCSCGKYLGKGYFVDKTSYCSDCGQKLDWSDVE